LITLLLDITAILIPVVEIKLILFVISFILISFILWFFRDPVRNIPGITAGEILSPADGKIMSIGEIEENHYLKTSAKIIAIFLSPLNVHVNRIPVSGVIESCNYIKGDYIVAFDHKSSEKNERTEIVINAKNFKVVFKQIAGFVARRIVCRLSGNMKVTAGDKFGMIKFGSRVDVIFPVNSVVKVSVNQKVKAGETILAEVIT
jgi:phosphatidylserine decarboxylase